MSLQYWHQARSGVEFTIHHSLFLESFHQLCKFSEQVPRIVRAGRRFRVVLDAKERHGFVPQAFKGLVVQVNVCQRHFTGFERVGVNSKPRDFVP